MAERGGRVVEDDHLVGGGVDGVCLADGQAVLFAAIAEGVAGLGAGGMAARRLAYGEFLFPYDSPPQRASEIRVYSCALACGGALVRANGVWRRHGQPVGRLLAARASKHGAYGLRRERDASAAGGRKEGR